MKKSNLILGLATLFVGLITPMAGSAFDGTDTIKINFQPAPGETNSTFNKWPDPANNPVPNPPASYFFDEGLQFGDRGNGLSYGFLAENKKSRWRKVSFSRPDSLLFQSFNHLQNGGGYNVWEIAVPNGVYNVMLVCGDPNFGDFISTVNIEGKTITDPTPVKSFESGGGSVFDTLFATVNVHDGLLTFKPDTASALADLKAQNVKFAFVHISQFKATFPENDSLRINFQPAPGETNSTYNKWPDPANNPVPNPPHGYYFDAGLAYGFHDNGYAYGYEQENKKMRWRKVSFNRPDSLLFQSFNHMQNGGTYNVWEVGVPNGTYKVRLVCGDPNFGDFISTVKIEGQTIIDPTPVKTFTTGGAPVFDTLEALVNVRDGRLTLNPDTASALGSLKADNVKFAFIEIVKSPINLQENDTLKINFQPKPGDSNTNWNMPVPEAPVGYFYDEGSTFALKTNGLTYGFKAENKNARWRKVSFQNNPDSLLLQTFNHIQRQGAFNEWEIEVPNGKYNVFLVCGDPDYSDFITSLDIEGVKYIDPTPVITSTSPGNQKFDSIMVMVDVTDGRLTIKPDTAAALGAAKAQNVKFAFVNIWSAQSNVAVESINLTDETKQLIVGSKARLTYTILPEEATNKSVVWSSANNNIVKVDYIGNIEAIAVGSAYVYVTTVDGNLSDSCLITVDPIRVTGIELSESTKTLLVGETFTLNATILPANASDLRVTWSSSNETVAQVSNTIVTAIAAGVATITATTVDGGFTATCSVTVEEEDTKVDPEMKNQQVNVYPNPVGNNGLLYIEHEINQEATVRVYDVTGKLLITKTLTASGGYIECENLDKGVYFLTLNGGNGIKFVKK